jgi:hypothetical protein
LACGLRLLSGKPANNRSHFNSPFVSA